MTWVDASAFVIPVVEGVPLSAGVVVVTERKRAEEALSHAQTELAHASRLTPWGC